MTVIEIRKSEDMPTTAQNRLRYAIELGEWRQKWRDAERENDYERMDRLQLDYERVGLP